MHCVDLDESFQTSILMQESASIQPRTSPIKIQQDVEDAAQDVGARTSGEECAHASSVAKKSMYILDEIGAN